MLTRFLPRLSALAALLLASCGTWLPMPHDASGPGASPAVPGPPPVARDATEPLRFGGLGFGALRRGAEIGRYNWNIDCAPPYERVFWTSGWNLRQGSGVEGRFREVMADAGFHVAGSPGGALAPAQDRRRARYEVTGELRHVALELCRRRHWLTGSDQGVSGTGAVAVDWSVFTAGEGRLVHRLSTRGTAALDGGVAQGDIALLEEAVAAAAGALAADPGFRAALSRGGGGLRHAPAGPDAADPLAMDFHVPESWAMSVNPLAAVNPDAPVDAVSRVDAPLPAAHPPAGPVAPGGSSAAMGHSGAALLVQSPPPSGEALLDPVERAASALVRVGNGRGVVIGEAGGGSVILTASAGVDATVKVRPATGVSLDGTVEARDAPTGLALVRVPARLPALPVRGRAARVSEMVLLALAGGGDQAAGIVASVRTDPRSGLELIQADLAGNGEGSGEAHGKGTSGPEAGDPLLDESGNLLGVAVGAGAEARPLDGAAQGLTHVAPAAGLLRRMGADLSRS
ncbi:S1C family serine protease [Azospirillum sp. SYSU D00513]|uniref:S1C family serine protease n=1 Tax=Azospirillum sp. SYSU D00513 TaxID=2812561 RepID=UPI001A963230|nr:S1C family serine protease [Azospirillum sp. SYSU D00513]